MTSLRPDPVVVDVGFVFRTLVPNAQQAALQQQISAWGHAGIFLHAPTLWRYELTSAISKALHFGHLTADEAQTALQLSQNFDIELHAPDAGLVQAAFAWTQRLRRANAYDSFYLALAQQLSCCLWAVDQRLKNAVAEDWVGC